MYYNYYNEEEKKMFDDTLELAENKLLLIYILEQIKLPISKNQFTEIVLENNLINYFTLQQYISELITAGFTEYNEVDGKHRLAVTSKGHKVLSMFTNRLSQDKIDVVDSYIKKNISTIRHKIDITADYTIANNNSFTVNLTALENDIALIDLKINVVSNKQARDICTKWKNNSSDLYTKIIKILIDD
jgi:predicted transcriptional regulator